MSDTPPHSPDTVSVDEAAQIIGYSSETVRRFAAKGAYEVIGDREGEFRITRASAERSADFRARLSEARAALDSDDPFAMPMFLTGMTREQIEGLGGIDEDEA